VAHPMPEPRGIGTPAGRILQSLHEGVAGVGVGEVDRMVPTIAAGSRSSRRLIDGET